MARFSVGPLQDLLEGIVGPDALPVGDRASLTEYLHELCRAPRALIVHGNYLDSDAMSVLERNRDHASVVYCPRTHLHFGHDPYPLMQLRSRGIRVILGTDSRASNPDLNILEEARVVRRAFPEIPTEAIFAMITTTAAEAFGFTRDWGTIGPGKRFLLSAIPCTEQQADRVLDRLLEQSDSAQSLESVIAALVPDSST